MTKPILTTGALPNLTTDALIDEALAFCNNASKIHHPGLKSDGKTIGTLIETSFQDQLKLKYSFTRGSKSLGIDLPDADINTDIKTTSNKQPQSSSPYKNATQKIYGLGHNLLVFVYEKNDDDPAGSILEFKHCVYIDKKLTGDYNTTNYLRELINVKHGNIDDVKGYLRDMNLPIDDSLLDKIANDIIRKVPEQGFLSISNALQWRLQFNRVIKLNNSQKGITNIV